MLSWKEARLSSSKEKKSMLLQNFRLENICGHSANISLVSDAMVLQHADSPVARG